MEKAKIFVFDVHHHPRNDYCVSVYYKEGEEPLREDNLDFSPYTVSFYIVPQGQGMTKMLQILHMMRITPYHLQSSSQRGRIKLQWTL